MQAMKAKRMRGNRTVTKLVKAFSIVLAVTALLFSNIATASAQERPRTLFDLLFGSRQAQPQRRGAQVTAYEGAGRPFHTEDATEAVGLQSMWWRVWRMRHGPILGDGAGCKRSPSGWEPVTFTPL